MSLTEKEIELIKVLEAFIQVMEGLPPCDETSLKVWDVYHDAKKVVEDIKGLDI